MARRLKLFLALLVLALPVTRLQGQLVNPPEAGQQPASPQAEPEDLPAAGDEDVPSRPVKDPPPEYRRHFVLRDSPDGTDYYRVTSIVRITDEAMAEFVLIDDLQHGTFLLEHHTSFPDDSTSYTIWDAKKKEFARASFDMPYMAKTWKGVRDESRRNPALYTATALLTIQTNGGEWLTSETEWKDWARMRDLRRAIRQTVPFFLLEAVERMRGTIFATSVGTGYYDVIGRYLVYQPADTTPAELQEFAAAPDCAFDKSFGYPCTDAQLARIKGAAETGKSLPLY
jgi:hypothetical protein